MILGYLEDGLVTIPKNPNDAISEKENVWIALIKEYPTAEPVQKRTFRIEDVSILECIPLYTKETFSATLNLGLIAHEYDQEHPVCRNWLLSHLIQHDWEVPEQILEVVFNDNPSLYNSQYTLRMFLNLTRNLSSTKFICKQMESHGISFNEEDFDAHRDVTISVAEGSEKLKQEQIKKYVHSFFA